MSEAPRYSTTPGSPGLLQAPTGFINIRLEALPGAGAPTFNADLLLRQLDQAIERSSVAIAR